MQIEKFKQNWNSSILLLDNRGRTTYLARDCSQKARDVWNRWLAQLQANDTSSYWLPKMKEPSAKTQQKLHDSLNWKNTKLWRINSQSICTKKHTMALSKISHTFMYAFIKMMINHLLCKLYCREPCLKFQNAFGCSLQSTLRCSKQETKSEGELRQTMASCAAFL